MKQKRDWVEYAGLASSIAQNVQLGGIENTLAELQKSEARKQANEISLAAFRANLFEQEDKFDALHKAKTSIGPNEFCVQLIAIQKILERWGQAYSRTISYDDKDRWRALAVRVGAARTEVEKDLPPGMAADLDQALDFSIKLPIMEANIEHDKKAEAYRDAKANLDMLTKRTAMFKTTRDVLAWVVFIVTVLAGAICGLGKDNAMLPLGPAILSFIAVYAVSYLHPTSALCRQRWEMHREVLRMEKCAPSGSGRSVADQIKHYHECITFINKVSGDEPIQSKFTDKQTTQNQS